MERKTGTEGGAARAILIAGPTASGKSALAMALAARCGGRVINADSMQVYRDIPVLSAQPPAGDRARVPHALFGHVDGGEAYSVGRWLADVAGALAAARAAGQRPVVVGGTGLYFKALTEGLSAIPAVPEAVRARLRAEAEGVPPEALHRRLAALDPAGAARLRPSDPQRLLRALEVFAATGRSLASFQAERAPALLPHAEASAWFLLPEPAALKARIATRFAAMMAGGALEEVAALEARRLDPALPSMRALGVPPLLAHLRGEIGREAAAEAATRATRAYARRQMTFGRHQLPGFTPVAPDAALAAMLAPHPAA